MSKWKEVAVPAAIAGVAGTIATRLIDRGADAAENVVVKTIEKRRKTKEKANADDDNGWKKAAKKVK